MADYCIEISIGHPLNNGVSWSRGDIVAVYPAEQIGVFDGTEYIPKNLPVPMLMTGWVFITGAPLRNLEIINGRLAAQNVDISLGVRVILNKRKWRAIVADIPAAIRNRINNNRYATFSWIQVKNYIRNRVGDALLTDGDI